MITIQTLPTYCFINKLENHHEIKNKLLSLINLAGGESQQDGDSHIEKTDFHTAISKNNEYADFFVEQINPIMSEIQKKLKGNGWNINRVWYQIYNKHDYHEWHNHSDTSFANVYYLNLPSDSVSTQFYDTLNNKIINVEVKEGDILTFPAFYLHKSPPNLSTRKKIVIAFNSNFPSYQVAI